MGVSPSFQSPPPSQEGGGLRGLRSAAERCLKASLFTRKSLSVVQLREIICAQLREPRLFYLEVLLWQKL